MSMMIKRAQAPAGILVGSERCRVEDYGSPGSPGFVSVWVVPAGVSLDRLAGELERKAVELRNQIELEK